MKIGLGISRMERLRINYLIQARRYALVTVICRIMNNINLYEGEIGKHYEGRSLGEEMQWKIFYSIRFQLKRQTFELFLFAIL